MTSTAAETPVEVSEADVLIPKSNPVSYSFGLDNHLSYTQRPLSFFGKIELLSIVGSAVEKSLADGGSIDEILGEGEGEADQFVLAIAKLSKYAPDFIKDICVIALGVPRDQQEYVKTVMSLPEEEGGLNDDQGIQILETFIDQNKEALVDFFKERILPLFNKITTRDTESQSSKPSKTTRPRIQKQ